MLTYGYAHSHPEQCVQCRGLQGCAVSLTVQAHIFPENFTADSYICLSAVIAACRVPPPLF